MFFFYLFSLIFSKNLTPMVGDNQFKKLVKSNKVVVALIIDEKESDFWTQAEKFSHIPGINPNLSYAVVTNENAPKAFTNYKMLETCLSFFINGTAFFACKMPQTVEGIAHVIRTSIMNETSTVRNMNEFKNFYKQFEYTIVTTKEREEEARVLYIRHTFSRGPLGFCVFSKEDFQKNFKSTISNNNEFIIYRSKEDAFESFDGTDETLYKACEYFVNEQIDEQYVVSGDKLLVLPIGNFSSQLDLITVAKQKHNHYQFGYLTNDSYSILKPVFDAININETNTPYITVINSTSLYAYKPLLSNFSSRHILNYLNNIEKGKIDKIYTSEQIPENELEPVNTTSKVGLYKLVGKTYEKFIKDESHDDFIIYCGDYQTDFKGKVFKIIKYMDDNNITGVRFAYIHANNNSCKVDFPEQLSLPHIELFPAKNHNKSIPYVGSLTVYSVLSFLNANGTIKFDVNETLIEVDIEKEKILENIYTVANYHNEKFRLLSEDYAQNIGRIIGLGDNISAISDNLINEKNKEKDKNKSRKDKKNHSKGKKSHKSESESFSDSEEYSYSTDSDYESGSSSDSESYFEEGSSIKGGKMKQKKVKVTNSSIETDGNNSTELEINETESEINQTEENITNHKSPKKDKKIKHNNKDKKKHNKHKGKKSKKQSMSCKFKSTKVVQMNIPNGFFSESEEETKQEL